ncbi:hypothetical protein MYSTI_01865 [Myxococcus stipitatus DSM 14675]|uniref:Uncharacterized protein n=1 Tax=Myxococcus stipitatus (strain DSM 14675 / JCM 12634 / Mx s8) TaxID=1278073 RepID=L7U6G5_MYXSD|nr:hypothetical protein [Myxococcus stipitatus]AGC43197.1 hypothetical protein MYSTI_01865 [Myxococcus stipitatus DSM 14675]
MSDQATERVTNLIDKVKAATVNRNSYEVNGTASCIEMPGYDIYGTAGRWGKLDDE